LGGSEAGCGLAFGRQAAGATEDLPMQIYDHTFLISGGSSGLGAACVRMLAGAGGNVVIADLNREAGEKLAADLGRRARFVHTNVTEEASVQNAVAAAAQAFGRLQGAVGCAGIAVAERVLGKSGPHDLAAFSRVIGVNLIGAFNVTRLAAAAIANAPPGPDGERGVIVNTASVAAFEGQIGQAAYSASKGGVASMTLPIARELARLGIRVLAVAPGIFDTPLLAGLPEPARQSLGQQVPFPSRLGRPEEFAALVRHLIENPMLNGTVVRLDGALRMAPK
jgi:NAD(P)-dependent dehydrogenase (short-subunit alcohol dehydrogenase family)